MKWEDMTMQLCHIRAPYQLENEKKKCEFDGRAGFVLFLLNDRCVTFNVPETKG